MADGSNSLRNEGRLPGGEARCSCDRGGEDGRSGGDWKSGATFWLRLCAESAAPPAEETVIGSFYIFTASGTQTGQKQELHTQQIRTKNESFFLNGLGLFCYLRVANTPLILLTVKFTRESNTDTLCVINPFLDLSVWISHTLPSAGELVSVNIH